MKSINTLSKFFHFTANMVLTGIILVGIGIGFLMITDTPNQPISQQIKANYSSESIRNPSISTINGNPEKWIIISVSEDYSLAKVLKEDGCVYYMTIFTATDDTIDIEVNGQIHEFYYTK